MNVIKGFQSQYKMVRYSIQTMLCIQQSEGFPMVTFSYDLMHTPTYETVTEITALGIEKESAVKHGDRATT